jgi:homoserine O-acetyltransferase/O-succinyltransferase
MTDSLYESSDSIRSGRELEHAQYAVFSDPLELERGGRLPEVRVAYETYGELNERRDNAILISHALSGDSHVARHDDNDDPGWWDLLIGPGKMIDTNRYFVICSNTLGGCRGTTGPDSINPETGRRYGIDFPVITVGDIVEAQRRLIDHLGIDQLLAVVGGSLGGLMTLQWATAHPDRLRGAIAVATSARLTTQALAFDIVGRNAILLDPAYNGGQYYDEGEGHGPSVGLAIARMLGHITYLSPESMRQKFDAERMKPRQIETGFETEFSVGSYLAYQGDKFVERFDANSYLALSKAMDLYDLGETREKLAEAFRRSTCRWLMISYTSDWLFPAFQSQEMVNVLLSEDKPVSYSNVKSDCGHDAFLLPDELDCYGAMIAGFLKNTEPEESRPSQPERNAAKEAKKPRRGRPDFDLIAQLIFPGSSVLDLGCGGGSLLKTLRRRCEELNAELGTLVGIDIDQNAVLRAVQRGFDVVQSDLDEGLPVFHDGQFDYVVLSKTLQSVSDVNFLLDEMLRVGKKAIVSFPNMGYRKYREQLASGSAPEIDQGASWFEMDTVRFLTIADFEAYCAERGVTIHQTVALDSVEGKLVKEDPNLNADVAIMVLSR